MFLQQYAGNWCNHFLYNLLSFIKKIIKWIKLNLISRIKLLLLQGELKVLVLILPKIFIVRAKVIIWDIDPKMIEKSSKELDDPNLSTNLVDVSNYNEVENCVNDIFKKSKIDILINNAGITGPTASLWEYDVEMWKKVVDINLMGTFNCCRAIVPNMIKNNYGRIVNVASVAGKDGNANASAYSVGKAGAIGLTKSLGKELADKNIAVNAVTPAGAKHEF